MARRRRDAGPDLFTLACQECGRPLVRTSGDYLACPQGHGRLALAAQAAGILADSVPDAEPCGSWFEADSPAAMGGVS